MNTQYDSRVLGKNVVVSGDSLKSGINNNVLVVGGSGSGKTGGYTFLNLKHFSNNSSAVVFDSKGQLYSKLKNVLKAKGYHVFNIDFCNPKKSNIGWNPLSAMLSKDGTVSFQNVLNFCEALIPIKSNVEEIWPRGSQTVLSFIIAYALTALPREDANINTVVSLFHKLIQTNGFTAFLPWCEEHPDSYASKKLSEITGAKSADKMLSSYYNFVSAALDHFYAVPELNELFTSKRCINLENIGQRKTALFITMPDCDRSLSNIVSVLTTQIFSSLLRSADNNLDGKLKVPVMLYLDDFTNIHVKDFDLIASITRSRDIGLSVMIQSLSQLKSEYGEAAANTILCNMDTILYLQSNDADVIRYIADRTNRTPDSIMSLPRDKSFVIMSGRPAILADKLAPYCCDPDAISFQK